MSRNNWIVAVISAVLMLSGCANYSRGTLVSLADRNAGAVAITRAMCADFGLASQAALHGDDKAYPVLGMKTEIGKLSIGLSKHSIQCFSAMDRLERETNPMNELLHGRILADFIRSWKKTKALVGE